MRTIIRELLCAFGLHLFYPMDDPTFAPFRTTSELRCHYCGIKAILSGCDIHVVGYDDEIDTPEPPRC